MGFLVLGFLVLAGLALGSLVLVAGFLALGAVFFVTFAEVFSVLVVTRGLEVFAFVPVLVALGFCLDFASVSVFSSAGLGARGRKTRVGVGEALAIVAVTKTTFRHEKSSTLCKYNNNDSSEGSQSVCALSKHVYTSTSR